LDVKIKNNITFMNKVETIQKIERNFDLDIYMPHN
jgi:hypothetical protein